MTIRNFIDANLEDCENMHVDGEEHQVRPGDIILNKPYGTHGLENNTDRDLKILVLGIGV